MDAETVDKRVNKDYHNKVLFESRQTPNIDTDNSQFIRSSDLPVTIHTWRL